MNEQDTKTAENLDEQDIKIAENMIKYIEELETKIKAENSSGGSSKKASAKVTTYILRKLEEEIKNADQES